MCDVSNHKWGETMDDSIYHIDDYDLDPFQQKMRRRIESVKGMLRKLKKVDLKEFVAKVHANCGVHEATARRYLNNLEVAGYIEIKDGTIIWKE